MLAIMAGVSGPLLSTLRFSHSVCQTIMKHVTWTVTRSLSRQLRFLSSSTASFLGCNNHPKAPFRKSTLPGHEHLLEINSSCLHSQKRYKHEVEYPPLIESEIEEKFIRGSGPGGQKINKTSNCVMLKHLPTGIVVKCQESRSLETNRARARRHLQERLDWYYNGEQSVLAQEKQEQIRKKMKSKNATNRKLEKLRQFKEREGLD